MAKRQVIPNVRSKDLRPGDTIVSGPNGGGSIDTYAFWTVEREVPAPPLPTEPFVVIRGKRSGHPDREYVLLRSGAWLELDGTFVFYWDADELDLESWALVSYPPTYLPVIYQYTDGSEQKG